MHILVFVLSVSLPHLFQALQKLRALRKGWNKFGSPELGRLFVATGHNVKGTKMIMGEADKQGTQTSLIDRAGQEDFGMIH